MMAMTAVFVEKRTLTRGGKREEGVAAAAAVGRRGVTGGVKQLLERQLQPMPCTLKTPLVEVVVVPMVVVPRNAKKGQIKHKLSTHKIETGKGGMK